MDWLELDDENVLRVGHDKESLALGIEFASGNTYLFHGVAPRFVAELKAAKDPSRYVRKHLMPRYEFSRA